MTYNNIVLPEFPGEDRPKPYMMIMPDGSVEDANKLLRGYIPETEKQ